MSDLPYGPEHFLFAEAVVSSIAKDYENDFQIQGETWDRETMQRHVNERSALILTQRLLLDAGERLLEEGEEE